MQEKPIQHLQLHRFTFKSHVHKIFFNNNFNHPPEKRRRETELKSEKMLNVPFFFYLKGKIDERNWEGVLSLWGQKS